MNDFEKFVSEHDTILKSQIVDNESMAWNVFSNRFVAFLDISGFKVTTKYPYYSYSLLQAFKGIAFKEQEQYNKDGIDRLFIVAVSDSIVVFTKDDSIESFCCFAHVVGKIFNISLLFKRFLNAAMACGNTFVNRDLLIFGGEAYNRAYTLQESMDYYGILCDPSVAEYLAKNKECKNEFFNLYQKQFLDVRCYIKDKSCNKNNIPGKWLNFFWYNFVLYNDILDTRAKWGNEEIRLCAIDQYGTLAGSYFDFITEAVQNYGEDSTRIKQKINNTMDVLESMLSLQTYNYNQKFERLKID